MADFSDVENTLVEILSGIIYPNGIDQESIVNTDVRIFRGWPIPANLGADLKANIINVSVNKIRGMERVTTRFDISWQTLSINSPTLTATVQAGNPYTITLGGTVSVYQTIMVLYNGSPFPYVVQEDDTLSTISTNIASNISGASATDNVISFSAAWSLIARVGVTGTAIRETKRQEDVFSITFWTPNFSLRDSICSAVDAALSALIRITLPDGYYARIRYMGSPPEDNAQKAHLYQRSLNYAVEFATTLTEKDYTITDPFVNLTVGPIGEVNIPQP